MAKPLVVQFGAASSSFAIHLLEGSDIYGARRRVVLDAQGRPCTRAALTPDGRQLLASGMTAQGYFTAAGRSVAGAALVGLDAKGDCHLAQALDPWLGADLRRVRFCRLH